MEDNMIGSAGFKDRKTGLIVFGIMEIIFGALCFMMVPVMIICLLISSISTCSPAAQMNAGTMIPSIMVYVLLAVWFIWMGIGSLKARRWARALWLVASWIWLACGIIGMITTAIFLPGMYDQMINSNQIPVAIAGFLKILTFGFIAVFHLLIPGVLILFYGSRHVKATCERDDIKERWTDKCPLPVLALSLVLWFWTGSLLFTGLYGWAIPFFGVVLDGLAGAGVVLISMLLLGYAAWGVYRLRVQAWICAVALVSVWGLSSVITFSQVSLVEYYQKMNFPAQQLEVIKSFMQLPTSTFLLLIGLWIVVILAFLLYTGRWFFNRPPAPGAGSGTV